MCFPRSRTTLADKKTFQIFFFRLDFIAVDIDPESEKKWNDLDLASFQVDPER